MQLYGVYNMFKMNRSWMLGIVSILCLVTLTGCTVVSYRKNTEFEGYFDSSKTVVVVKPDINMYKLTAGGVDEFNAQWTAASRVLVSQRIKQELENYRSIKTAYMETNNLAEDDQDILDQQAGMFFVVSNSIITHTYLPESSFPHKIKHFNYTMGKEISALQKFGSADTYLFCSGRNYIWTAGRATLATFGLLVGAATGVTIIIPAGPEWIVAALVDAHTGNVIWFNYIPMPGDMREEKVVDRVIRSLFKSFPEKWR